VGLQQFFNTLGNHHFVKPSFTSTYISSTIYSTIFTSAATDITKNAMGIRKSRMEKIKNEHVKEVMGVKGKPDSIRHHREEKTTMVWPRHKDARGENTEINYGMSTRGEKKQRTSKKTWMEGVHTAMTRNLEPDQWRNREEWRFVSGRRRQLL
jgi:hypothetical protein